MWNKDKKKKAESKQRLKIQYNAHFVKNNQSYHGKYIYIIKLVSLNSLYISCKVAFVILKVIKIYQFFLIYSWFSIFMFSFLNS